MLRYTFIFSLKSKEMERKSILIANYSQEGHHSHNEDTWDESAVIENERELLNVMKSWHKKSASTFGNYPFGGLFSVNRITFQVQKIIDDNGDFYYSNKISCEPPTYLENVKQSFNEWFTSIKERLPKLREARDKRVQETAERKKLQELTEKYK